MADETTSSWEDFLEEVYQGVVEMFPMFNVLLAEFSGNSVSNKGKTGGDASSRFAKYEMDGQPGRAYEDFHGKVVIHPVQWTELQGAGPVGENETINKAHLQEDGQTMINIFEYAMPISLSRKLDLSSYDASVAKAVARKMKDARVSLARVENEAMNGNDDGLIASVANATGAAGLTIQVKASDFNRFNLYPNRVVDIRDKTTWTFVTKGKKRKIASVDKTASPPTVTFDTAASNGDAGDITWTANSGLYVERTANTSKPPVSPGLQALASSAKTGTFQGINRATFPGWRGVDGRNGSTTVVTLSQGMLDDALNEMINNGADEVDFWIGDPRVISKYEDLYRSQHGYAAPVGTLMSGFKGATHKSAPLISEPAHRTGSLTGITKSDLQVYAFRGAPEFLSDDGSMWRRFDRNTSREAWLVDEFCFAAQRVNRLIELKNLQV